MLARAVLRAAGQATLATALGREGRPWPYASLVEVALDHDAAPLLLLSDLAQHSKNIAVDSHVSLLFDGTAGYASPLAGPRVTLLGKVAPVSAGADEAPRLWSRYVARHPDAAGYRQFSDFRLYRVAPAAAHLVGGFGNIHWLESAELLLPAAQWQDLAAAEPEIVAHMNQDHGQAIDLMAQALLGLAGAGWRMTGVDPEGADIALAGQTERLGFAAMVHNATDCRRELVRLTKAARAGQR